MANLTFVPSSVTILATGNWGADATDVVEDYRGAIVQGSVSMAVRRFASRIGVFATMFCFRCNAVDDSVALHLPMLDTRQNQSLGKTCLSVDQISDNHAIHTEHGVGRLELVNQLAVPGDRNRYRHLVALEDCARFAHARLSLVQACPRIAGATFPSSSSPMPLEALGGRQRYVLRQRFLSHARREQRPNTVLRKFVARSSDGRYIQEGTAPACRKNGPR